MKYTSLVARKLESTQVSVSVDPTNPDWFKRNEGQEFLVKVDMVIQGSVLNNYHHLNGKNHQFNVISHNAEQLSSNGLTDLCKLSGTLILADEMTEEGYDPYGVCNRHAEELEFVYSVLKTYNFDYSMETERMRNIFYIDEISWEDHVDYKTRFYVMNQLKGFLIDLYHVRVDILCIEADPLKPVDDFILTEEGKEFMMKILKGMLEKQEAADGHYSKIIDFKQFIPMKEKNDLSSSSNGKENETVFIEINENELIHEFANYGFKKVGNTSLLAKFV